MSISEKIVNYLENYPNEFVPRKDLVKAIWGDIKPVDKYTDATLRVHMITAKDIAYSRNSELMVVTGQISRGYLLKK